MGVQKQIAEHRALILRLEALAEEEGQREQRKSKRCESFLHCRMKGRLVDSGSGAGTDKLVEYWMCTECDRNWKRVFEYAETVDMESGEVLHSQKSDKADSYIRAYSELYDAARVLLDVTEYDGQGSEMAALRRSIWNESDTEAQREAEGNHEV